MSVDRINLKGFRVRLSNVTDWKLNYLFILNLYLYLIKGLMSLNFILVYVQRSTQFRRTLCTSFPLQYAIEIVVTTVLEY